MMVTDDEAFGAGVKALEPLPLTFFFFDGENASAVPNENASSSVTIITSSQIFPFPPPFFLVMKLVKMPANLGGPCM